MDILEGLFGFKESFFTFLFFIVLYYAVRMLLNRQARGIADFSLIKTILLFSIVLIGLISIILALPLGDSKEEITNLIGIVISAVLALSSATFIGNAFAGIMLKTIKNFKPGDFVEVKDMFGRITEMSLFHSEIQTENRDLITVPNLLLTTNPVKVTRSSGTFICTSVSLGYDIPRVKIEEAMLGACHSIELKDPFVLVCSLGDFSITYKVQGLLEDVKNIISARSKLNGAVIDFLHNAGIEIVSPTFMNQRQIKGDVFIPDAMVKDKTTDDSSKRPENLIFDKAEIASGIEVRRKYLIEVDEKIKLLSEELKQTKDADTKGKLNKKINSLKRLKVKTQDIIDIKLEDLSK